MDLSELKPEDRFVGLFIGRSGSGKKSAAASFPHPIKYLDFDGRVRGINGSPWVEQKGIDVDFFPPKGIAGQPSLVDRVNNICEMMMVEAQKGNLRYKTVILGSLTGETNGMIQAALGLTHGKRSGPPQPGESATKGKFLGTLAMPGPEDYGYEAQGTYQLLSFLRTLPNINLIVTAHVVDRYGKLTDSEGNILDPYSESVVIGEKLSVRDKIAENSLIYFDNIFRFSKIEVGTSIRHQVKFRSDMARTIYPKLPNGEVDITGKDFHKYLMENVKDLQVVS